MVRICIPPIGAPSPQRRPASSKEAMSQVTKRRAGRESLSPSTCAKWAVVQHSSFDSFARVSPWASANWRASRSSDGISPGYALTGSAARTVARSARRWYARRTETSETMRSSPIRRISDSTETPQALLSLSRTASRNELGRWGSICSRGVSNSAANSSASRSCWRSPGRGLG